MTVRAKTAGPDPHIGKEGPKGGQPPLTMPVPLPGGGLAEKTEVRMFRLKKTNYLWDDQEHYFYRLPHLCDKTTTEQLASNPGLSRSEQRRRSLLYGANAIAVPVRGVPTLVVKEALNPFYIFQVFSVILWYLDDYTYYASVIVVTSVTSLASRCTRCTATRGRWLRPYRAAAW